ncbi:type IV pilus secretin PilQ [Ramlibacter sp. G-1-2-2]|uniref:Type IV pilus secretin PilQ n=2 Tax=Ramlibacter agri TaxID=2728837 RepID=A0A848H0S2_9BURK|nr:type IV pilus secretin PilQ [Ramlibacter agri]NML43232.1 type IV pilus secretin PilQ [Ramlibacter agri]
MVVALGATTAAAQPAQEPLAVRSVTAVSQDGEDMLRVELSRPLAEVPAGFAIQSPPRLAFDLPGAVNGTDQGELALEQGNLRSARIVEAEGRTRVVLALRSPASWKARLEGNLLLVSVAATAPQVSARPQSAPELAKRGVQPLKDIDFRRGANGVGRVLVELPRDPAGVDVRQEGNKLVVEFLRTSLPQGLRRRLDVTDFGTPVRAISTVETGDRVRMEIEGSGAWEQSAYQTDNQFVIEVRPRKDNPDKLTAGPGYTGEKLSLNFQNIEVRALLQVMADFTHFNIITADSVSGALTLRLQDVPWDQALDIILQARHLGMRRQGNVLWVAPRDEIAAREKQELEAGAAIQTLEPLRTQAFQLNYSKAADVAAQLTAGTGAARLLSTRGGAMPEPRTNQLFVTDIPSRLEAVQDLITKIDIPVRQVLIEARIVEASTSFGKSLGAKLGITDNSGGYKVGNTSVAVGNTYDAVSASTGQTSASSTSTTMVNLPATGQGGYDPASFAVSLFNVGAGRFLNMELSALEADGKGKVVSSPRVITANQAKALIEQGTEFPYQQATSSGATSVSFRKATLKLEVTPQITPDGNVILDLEISKDSKGETTAAGVAIDTKHVHTQALVENGGTVVIGGIFEMTDSDSDSHVPVLGELPGLGMLFRARTTSRSKQEMLVFITPRILQDARVAR